MNSRAIGGTTEPVAAVAVTRKAKMKARCVALVGGLLGGALVLLPIPIFDVVLLMTVQLIIMLGVTLMLHKPIHFVRQGLFVCGYALAGAVVCLGLQIFIPILGKLLLAPAFAAFWCYLLGELTLFSVSRR